jgi:Lar family restriction alleviation protein
MVLKPCPFCGGEAILAVRDDPANDCHWFWVTCRICKVGQPPSLYTVEQSAETAWNDRCTELLVDSPIKFV